VNGLIRRLGRLKSNPDFASFRHVKVLRRQSFT
jgi:hypothetical protein